MTIGELARADRDDGAQHPRPPDPRPAAAAGRARPHRLLQRGARRADRADPRNAGRGPQPGGDPPHARERRRLRRRRSSTSPAPCAPRSKRRRRRSSSWPSWPSSGEEIDEARLEMLERGEKLGVLRALPDGKVEVISPRLMPAGRGPGRGRGQPRGRPRHRREAAPQGQRHRPALHRPLRQGGLEALRRGGPPRGRLAEGARGPRSHAPACRRRLARRSSRSRWARRPTGLCERTIRAMAREGNRLDDGKGGSKPRRKRSAAAAGSGR